MTMIEQPQGRRRPHAAVTDAVVTGAFTRVSSVLLDFKGPLALTLAFVVLPLLSTNVVLLSQSLRCGTMGMQHCIWLKNILC